MVKAGCVCLERQSSIEKSMIETNKKTYIDLKSRQLKRKYHPATDLKAIMKKKYISNRINTAST